MDSTNSPKGPGSQTPAGSVPEVAAGTRVAILMGSDSDLPIMRKCLETLRGFGVPAAIHVLSAHRSPAAVAGYASRAQERGLEVLICAAGAAAHLAGVVAAHTTLPVLGVPMPSGHLNGLDSLCATVQMPGGVPVATFAIGEAGAVNAGVFAVQILALKDPALREKLAAHKEKLARGVSEKDAALQASLKNPPQ